MGYANVGQIQVGGPYNKDESKPKDTPSRRAIFICEPKAASEETSLCQQDSGKDGSAGLSASGNGSGCPDAGRSFSTRGGRKRRLLKRGIQFALERMLVDPDFLLRVIREPAKTACFGRLSFERSRTRIKVVVLSVEQYSRTIVCFRLPSAEQLTNPQNLDREVRRMMADPRAAECAGRTTSPRSG